MQSVLIIIAFNLFIFFRTLRFSICVDDVAWYRRIQDGLLDFKFMDNPIYWIKMRLYSGGLFGRAKKGEAPDAHLDHFVTICLHTAASVLVYYAFGQSQISFWASMLYSCNPTNAQTSVWLNGRRYLVNVILILLMITFPMAWIPLYAMTGLFQVTAIFVPVLFLGWYVIPAMAIFYLLFGRQLKEKIQSRLSSIQSKDWRNWSSKRLIVVVKCYGFYFFKTFLPGITLINYPELFYWGVTKEGNENAYSFNFDFFRGCLAGAATVALIIIVPWQYRAYAVFMALAIFQWCAIIPVTQMLTDRYASAAIPFMMFFVAYFIQSPLILAVIVGIYTAKLWASMDMFISIWNYFKYQIYHVPHLTTPRKDLISYCIKKGDHLSAWHYTREGLDYTPRDFSLLHRAAICARACGSNKQALEYLLKAEANPYLDQEESQKEWCKAFRDQMKKMDLAQLNNKKYGG